MTTCNLYELCRMGIMLDKTWFKKDDLKCAIGENLQTFAEAILKKVQLCHRTHITSTLKWNMSGGSSRPNGCEPKTQEQFHQIIEIHHWCKSKDYRRVEWLLIQWLMISCWIRYWTFCYLLVERVKSWIIAHSRKDTRWLVMKNTLYGSHTTALIWHTC